MKKLFLLILGLLLLPFITHAEEAKNTISIFPGIVAIEVPAGETTLQILDFTNRTGEKKTFTVQQLDYQMVDSEKKQIDFVELGSTDDSLQGLIDFTPIKFQLEDKETQEILVRIKPKSDTVNGQYKGVIFVGEEFEEGKSETNLAVAGNVGSIFGVTVIDGLDSAIDNRLINNIPSWVFFVLGLLAIVLLYSAYNSVAMRKAKENK